MFGHLLADPGAREVLEDFRISWASSCRPSSVVGIHLIHSFARCDFTFVEKHFDSR